MPASSFTDFKSQNCFPLEQFFFWQPPALCNSLLPPNCHSSFSVTSKLSPLFFGYLQNHHSSFSVTSKLSPLFFYNLQKSPQLLFCNSQISALLFPILSKFPQLFLYHNKSLQIFSPKSLHAAIPHQRAVSSGCCCPIRDGTSSAKEESSSSSEILSISREGRPLS